MAWAFMTASGTDSLIFNDNTTHDGSRSFQKHYLKSYRELHAVNFIMQQDNDLQHPTNTANDSMR